MPPENNEIDELSIKITADASEFLEGMEAAMAKALQIAEGQAEQIATDWVDVFSDIFEKEMATKATDFQQVFAKIFEAFTTGDMFDEDSIVKFRTALYETFEVISKEFPELQIPMETITYLINSMSTTLAEGRMDFASFSEQIQAITGPLEALKIATGDVGPLVATLKEHFVALGKNIPYAELDRMEAALLREAEAAKERDATVEETSARLREMTNDFHENIAAQSKVEEVSYRVQIAMAEMNKLFTTMGREVPNERLAEFAERIEELWKKGLEAQEPITELVERANELKKTFFELEIAEDDVAKGLEQIKKGFEDTGRVVPVAKIKQWEKGLRDVIKASKENNLGVEETNQQIQEYIKGVVEAREPTTTFERGLKQLASRFLSLAGLIMLWNRLKSKLEELYQIGLKYSEANYKMAVAIKEHDVALGGLGFTMAEVSEHADMLADTYKLDRLESKELMSQAMLTTHELKLTKDQIEELTKSAAIMGTVFGEDATAMLTVFTNYLTSNYISGMQQLGFDIDENTMRVEAIKRGYIEFGEELDKHTMKMVGLEMIQERANDLSQDAASYTETLAGKHDELTERMGIVAEKIGSVWAPAMLKLKEFAVEAAEAATESIMELFETLAKALFMIDAHLNAARRAREQAAAETGVTPGYGGRRDPKYGEFVARERELYEQFVPEEMEKSVREYMNLIGQSLDKTEEVETALGSVQARLSSIMGEYIDTVIEAADATAQELKKIEEEYERRADKLALNLSRQLAQLEEAMAKRRKDAWNKLVDSQVEINKRASEKRAEIERRHQEDAEREKKEHLLRMKRMEEDFLLSLEDAVRERDAKQVLLLKRQYSIERKRAKEDWSIRKKQRQEDYKLRLHETEVQRRLALQARHEAYIEELEQLAEQEAERRARLIDNYDRQLKDLRDNLMLRLKDKYDYIVDDLELTDMHIDSLMDRLNRFYGENGWLDSLWDYATASAAQSAALLASSMGLESVAPTTTGGGDRYTPYQRGGTFYATSPTMLKVGETPERVDITRLSAATGAVREPRATGGGQAVRIDLNVLADDRLIVEVADQTMNEVADVYVDIQRETQRRLRT